MLAAANAADLVIIVESVNSGSIGTDTRVNADADPQLRVVPAG